MGPVRELAERGRASPLHIGSQGLPQPNLDRLIDRGSWLGDDGDCRPSFDAIGIKDFDQADGNETAGPIASDGHDVHQRILALVAR